MSNRKHILGVDWGDVGQKTLGGLHLGGKLLLSAFGAGAIAAPLEQLETRGGALPSWAAKSITVDKPDYVVLARSSSDKPLVIGAPLKLVVYGGTRFDGNGYKHGDPVGTTFSFGVNAPTRVEVTTADKKTTSFTDVKQALLLGGTESSETIMGENMDKQVIDELEAICGDDVQATDADGNPIAPAGASSPSAQQFVPPPPASTGPSANMLRSSAYRAAQARADAAKARLAAVQAMQPAPLAFTPTPIEIPAAPTVPAFFTLPGATMSDNVTGCDDELNEVLGFVMEDGELGDDVVLGSRDEDNWTEVVGEEECHGLDAIVGAVTTRAGTVKQPLSQLAKKVAVKTTARTVSTRLGVKKTFHTAAPSKNRSPHKLAITRTMNAANRAHRAGLQAQNRAAHSSPVSTKVRGDEVLGTILGEDPAFGYEILGESQAHSYEIVGEKQLTPKQIAAKAKRAAASAKTHKAVANAKKKGDAAVASSAKAAAAAKKAKPIVDKLLAKPKIAATVVHGSFEVFGAQPGDPNYDPRFDDPNYSGDYSPPAGSDPTSGAMPSGYNDPNADPNAGAGAPADYSDGGDIPIPTRGQALSKDDASVVWNDVPDDGVIYQGDKGFPANSVGSWSRWYGPDGNGKQTLKPFIDAMSDSQYTSNDPGVISRWVAQHPNSPLAKAQNREITPGYFLAGSLDPNNPVQSVQWHVQDQPADWSPILKRVAMHPEDDDGEIEAWTIPPVPKWSDPNDTRAFANNSIARGWGPLIGNPSGPLAGLQYAMNSGQWFWQSQNAPKWATAEQDAQITALNKAANDAANAAAAADAARQQQEQAQMAEAEAAQQEQLALAQNQADAQAAITQQQIDQQQQIADAQAAAQQTALDLQQAALEQKALQADVDYGIAHPEEFAAMQAQQDQEQAPDDLTDITSRDDLESQVDRMNYGDESDFNVPTQADNEAAANAFDEEG